MAEFREWTFTGSEGALHAGSWSGDDEPSHIVLIAHGYGEHIGRYHRLADALVSDGAIVYALDHLGHGRSDGERVLISDFDVVVQDLHRLYLAARSEQGTEIPVILLGHSMGGLIASRYAQTHGQSLSALVLSSPVLGRWSVVDDLLALDEIPEDPLDVSTLSRDPDVGRAYQDDPLVWHGPFKRRTLLALHNALDGANHGAKFEDMPVLWIHGDDDHLVPRDQSQVGINQLAGSRMTRRTYEGGRHELFNEINSDEVIADVRSFVIDVVAAVSADAPERR